MPWSIGEKCRLFDTTWCDKCVRNGHAALSMLHGVQEHWEQTEIGFSTPTVDTNIGKPTIIGWWSLGADQCAKNKDNAKVTVDDTAQCFVDRPICHNTALQIVIVYRDQRIWLKVQNYTANQTIQDFTNNFPGL